MRLHVYDFTHDAKGNPILRFVGSAETWRGAHEFRRLTRERRKDGNTTITTIVYDNAGRFICTP